MNCMIFQEIQNIFKIGDYMKKIIALIMLAGFVNAGQIFNGDGSDEAGFVPPPRKEMPPPPSNMAGGETLIPYPPPPAAPMSRSEKKNPPRPPIKIIKLKSEFGEQDWNARPNDVNNLLKRLKEETGVDWDYECRFMSEIYIAPTLEEKEKVRKLYHLDKKGNG